MFILMNKDFKFENKELLEIIQDNRDELTNLLIRYSENPKYFEILNKIKDKHQIKYFAFLARRLGEFPSEESTYKLINAIYYYRFEDPDYIQKCHLFSEKVISMIEEISEELNQKGVDYNARYNKENDGSPVEFLVNNLFIKSGLNEEESTAFKCVLTIDLYDLERTAPDLFKELLDLVKTQQISL